MPKNAPEGPKAPIHAENQLFHEMAANKSPGKIHKIEKSDESGKMKSRDAAGPEGSATNKRKHRRRQSQIVEETFKTV